MSNERRRMCFRELRVSEHSRVEVIDVSSGWKSRVEVTLQLHTGRELTSSTRTALADTNTVYKRSKAARRSCGTGTCSEFRELRILSLSYQRARASA